MDKKAPRCVGVVGGGSIGLRHAANLLRLGVADVVILDLKDRARERASNGLENCFVSSSDEFWAREPSVVLVCTPSAHHLEDARTAVEHGCDVFVEKPQAVTLDGCEDLAVEAESGELVTMVACNMRFHPGPATVKRLLSEGRAGQVLSSRIYCGSYLPKWRPWLDYRDSYSADVASGGAILDCIHEIDLALWYFGPARLRAAVVRDASAIGLKTDGLAELLLEHESGVLCSMRLAFVQRDYRRGCEIIGDRGSIYWDWTESRVTVFDEDGDPEEQIPLPKDYDVNAMYLSEMEHFLDCVNARTATCNSLREGLEALSIALAAKGSPR